MNLKMGDLVMYRPPYADFPKMGEVLKPGRMVLLETGVKGKGVVDRASRQRIFRKVQ